MEEHRANDSVGVIYIASANRIAAGLFALCTTIAAESRFSTSLWFLLARRTETQ